ncbi:MAG: iron chelate uptake ABC transporter family permease subunit [Chloroflexi bacterium]|nr:iron chelate uptake ABC transporter family permease subunit [Chloroflexota bacterium]
MRPYLLNITLLALAFLLSVGIGSVFIPPMTVLRIFAAQATSVLSGIEVVVPFIVDWPQAYQIILFSVRLPHTILVALTGAALAGSGAAYQGLFRNPLADPFLIGVASGAGLGAVLALSRNWPDTWFGFYAVPLAAFLGAIVTVIIVYNLAKTQQAVQTTTLILAGVAVSSFATALTSLLMLRSDAELRRALGWLLGGSILGGWTPVWAVLPYITLGLITLMTMGHALNVLQFGDEQAQQMGLSVERTKRLLIVAASLTTAAAVAFSGIIGFIGLIVPHLVRMIWGPDYRRLVPLSIIGGSTALLLADLLARSLLAPQILPVGIVTALAGAPFFLWILYRSKTKALW